LKADHDEMHPSKGWIINLAFLFASGLLLLCAFQATVGYPFRRTIKLEPLKMIAEEGFAYSVVLPTHCLPYGPQTSSSRLIEDAISYPLYSQKPISVATVGKGIFSFAQNGRLLFSASDNSDPRVNGRVYQIQVPLPVSRRSLQLVFAIWLALGATYFLCHPERHVAHWRRRIGPVFTSVVTVIGRWPAIVLAIPSLYLLISYPPLWKDTDAMAQLTLPAGDGNILQFPPIYCFLGRIPFALTSWIQPAGTIGSYHGIWEQQNPSLLGIYLLVIGQHLILIASLTYTIVALTANHRLRVVFALFLASFSSFYTHAQCCGSEALSIPATFAIFATGIMLLRFSSFLLWIGYGVVLFLAIGTRHINLVFSIWLPMTMLTLSLLNSFGWRSGTLRRIAWREIALAVVVGVLAIGADHLMVRSMIAASHDEYRSTLGRTLSDRITGFLEKLSVEERSRLADSLAGKAADPLVQAAIKAQASLGSYYNGTDIAITRELRRSGVPQPRLGSERDRVILAATQSYLWTGHPILMQTVFSDFSRGFTHADSAKIALEPFCANQAAAWDKMKRPRAWTALAALPSLKVEDTTVQADAAARDPYITFWQKVPIGILLLCALIAACAACAFRQAVPELVVAGVWAIATGTFAYFANSVCAPYMDRYTLPLLIVSVIGILASATSIADQKTAAH
jgi:hypothetical protein